MTTELRTDESHNVSYPQTPDTRGTARIYHMRKPYYLGNHDSPLSYVMFGLWKHRLLEQGEAPTTASIREQAEAFLGIYTTRKIRRLSNCLMVLALTLTTLIGALVGAGFRSTPADTDVDGIALSANEMEFIRGVRKQNQVIANGLRGLTEQSSQDTVALTNRQVSKNEIFKRIRGN